MGRQGALDIQLRRDRLRAIGSALVLATAGFVACTAILATIAFLALGLSPLQATIMAVPFAVISSAVAIPSSQHLPPAGREFIVYESAISDIIGVMFFLSLINSDGTPAGVMMALAGGGLLSLLLAVVFAIGLALVLMRIDGHIRFIPLLSGLFGLYAAGELLHLSPLMLVLLFGLALNNPTLLTRFRPVQRWLDDSYESTLAEFKMLILELAFAVRGFFFILLGYWTNLTDLMSLHAWIGAGLVLAVIYLSRRLLLRLARLEMADALTWLAPRGLVTVLLFLTAGNHHELPAFLDGTVMLVVLVSATLTAAGRSRRAEAAQVPDRKSVV